MSKRISYEESIKNKKLDKWVVKKKDDKSKRNE